MAPVITLLPYDPDADEPGQDPTHLGVGRVELDRMTASAAILSTIAGTTSSTDDVSDDMMRLRSQVLPRGGYLVVASYG